MPQFTTTTVSKTKTYIRAGAAISTLIGVGLIGYFFVMVPLQSLSGDNVGKLEPTEPPGNLSYSLEDIYSKLVYGKNTDLSQKKSAPASAPSDTQVTLDNIYQNIPPADKICKGVNAGTVECGGAGATPISTPTETSTPAPTPTETATPTPSPSPSPVAQENLVLWLPFNETSGSKFTDSSSQQNNGKCYWGKCPQIGKTGKVDKAVEFDGINDYIYSSKNLSFQEGITVGTWINFKKIEPPPPTDSKTTSLLTSIFSMSNQPDTSSGYHWFYFYKLSSGNQPMIGWQYAIANNTYTGKYSYISPLNLNEWYHMVVTHDYHNNKIVLYINGILAGEFSPAEAVIHVTDKQGRIGSYNGAAHFLDGFLDEFKIYNKALSEKEVEKEYDSYQ